MASDLSKSLPLRAKTLGSAGSMNFAPWINASKSSNTGSKHAMRMGMVKTIKALPGKHAVKVAPVGTTVVRNAKTGQSVTVKGAGALKGNDLKIKKGVSLLKPIAEQALMLRSAMRKTGIQHSEKRKAG